jgi:hypothetical protein
MWHKSWRRQWHRDGHDRTSVLAVESKIAGVAADPPWP